MIKTDKNNRLYVFVSLEDIIKFLETTDDPDIKNQLKRLYQNEQYNELGYIRISKNSDVYKAMMEVGELINGDLFMNVQILSDAYTRACIECNHEMKSRLYKYLKAYDDNAIHNIDNSELLKIVLCDKKIMTYIHKYDSLEEFIQDPSRKKESVKTKKESRKKGRSLAIIS